MQKIKLKKIIKKKQKKTQVMRHGDGLVIPFAVCLLLFREENGGVEDGSLCFVVYFYFGVGRFPV